MNRKLQISWLGAALLGLGLITTAMAASKKAPEDWDGLKKVDRKGVDLVYLLPAADFKPYTQVIMDPVKVEFAKNWQRDMNDTIDLSRKIDADDITRIRTALSKMVQDGFTKELSGNGYPVVTAPAANTLQISTAIVNLYVNAPDIPSAGRSRTYTTSAGQMTLVLEARDSVTGQVLARAVDLQEDQGFNQMQWTNSVTNAADADIIIRGWAKKLREGLDRTTGKTPPAKK